MAHVNVHKSVWISLGVVLFLIVALGVYLTFLQAQGVPEVKNEIPTSSEAVIYEGTYVCLETLETPRATECTPGITLDNGDRYALDLGFVIEMGGNPQLTKGTRIIAGGEVVGVEEISSDQWQKFSIKGIMRVEEVARQ